MCLGDAASGGATVASLLRIPASTKLKSRLMADAGRKEYGSFNLVYPYRVTLGSYREIGDERAA
jgi:hypothetical protein